jgi:hypothetical protein
MKPRNAFLKLRADAGVLPFTMFWIAFEWIRSNALVAVVISELLKDSAAGALGTFSKAADESDRAKVADQRGVDGARDGAARAQLRLRWRLGHGGFINRHEGW